MAALGDLTGLAARISAKLTREEIPHAVSGAIAMAAHGHVRATIDLDILVVTESMRLPVVFEIVRRQGFEGDDRDLIDSLRTRYVAALRSGPVTVEILVPVLPYHHGIVDRAVRRPVSGEEVPFVGVEDLVILKLLWRRAKDLADLQALVAATPDLDAEFVRATLAEILPAEDPRRAEFEDLVSKFGRD
ncbi:MAG: nucleotidyltransferase [Planctomycetota bacterium]